MPKQIEIPRETEIEFLKNSASVAADLYYNIERSHNIVISPFSIYNCIALAFMGAAKHTADEMAQGLKLPTKDKSNIAKLFQKTLKKFIENDSMHIGNKIYLSNRYEFNSDFHQLVSNYLNAENETISFERLREAVSTINDWVKKITKNKIDKVIDESHIEKDAVLILFNVVHFKGMWKIPFSPKNTQKRDFWINENEKKLVDMMECHGTFKFMHKCKGLDASIIELEYKGPGNISMMVILPLKRTGLRELHNNLRKCHLLCISRNLKPSKIDVRLPKFKIEYLIELNHSLEMLGMKSLFNHNADFSNMIKPNSSQGGVLVSKIIQKACIEVNEQGTEAGAATAAVAVPLSGSTGQFIADHPFFFVIKTKLTILFSGRFTG